MGRVGNGERNVFLQACSGREGRNEADGFDPLTYQLILLEFCCWLFQSALVCLSHRLRGYLALKISIIFAGQNSLAFFFVSTQIVSETTPSGRLKYSRVNPIAGSSYVYFMNFPQIGAAATPPCPSA